MCRMGLVFGQWRPLLARNTSLHIISKILEQNQYLNSIIYFTYVLHETLFYCCNHLFSMLICINRIRLSSRLLSGILKPSVVNAEH